MKKKKGLNEWTSASFWDMVDFHKKRLHEDRRVIILWIVEIVLAVMIAAAIAIYLDPDWNVVPFPYNIVAFATLVAIALLIHRRTKPFRIARRITAKKKGYSK